MEGGFIHILQVRAVVGYIYMYIYIAGEFMHILNVGSFVGYIYICHRVTTGPPKGTCTIQNDPRICYTCLTNT